MPSVLSVTAAGAAEKRPNQKRLIATAMALRSSHALAAITGLFGLPAVFGWLWVVPTFGYMLGRMAVDSWRCQPRDYWFCALGS